MWVCCPRADALTGIRVSGQGPGGWAGGQVPAMVCVRPGLVWIGAEGWPNPDWKAHMSNPIRGRARPNLDREHGRVKFEMGRGRDKKRKEHTWGCWFLPAAFDCVVVTGQQYTKVFT